MSQQLIGLGASAAVLLGSLGFLAYSSLFTVEAGHRAIMYSRITGVNDKFVYSEGTHFRIPVLDRPIIYDVRTHPRIIQSLTGTRDLQMVNVSIRVLFRPASDKLSTIYRSLGKDFDERVLPSIVNEVLKSVVAKFNASQLLTQREQVSRLVRQNLISRANDFNIVVDDVSITHLSFGKEFSDAIEAKQVAAQQAERAKYVVMSAEQEKLATIIKAEGDAKAAELLGKAMSQNPSYIKLKKIEASLEIANTISQSKNRALLDSDSLFLNIDQLLKD